MFKRGDTVMHKACNVKCVVLNNNHVIRGKGKKQKTISMIKCRYFSNGLFHVHEFFPEEIRTTMIGE